MGQHANLGPSGGLHATLQQLKDDGTCGMVPADRLDIQGTAFQRRVWSALQEIPAGTSSGYGDVAARTDQLRAARAVAQACALNGIAVAIPYQRVLRSDGELGGYRCGVGRKRQILERVGVCR